MKKNKWSKIELDVNKVNFIERFVESVAKRMITKEKTQIDLVCSHGDFSLVNILKSKNGIKVIDWEGLDLRNPLFDFYNYFFTELYYNRPIENLRSVLKNWRHI